MCNVGLTVSKGIAGLWMNSASLLAEAGHSLSDLLGVRLAHPVYTLLSFADWWIGPRDARYVADQPEAGERQVPLGLRQVRDDR